MAHIIPDGITDGHPAARRAPGSIALVPVSPAAAKKRFDTAHNLRFSFHQPADLGFP
jgi:hypothetical protein